MSYPNDFQKRTLWSAATGLAIVLLGLILVGMIWLGGQILGYLQPVLVPLAVAGITAYLLDPVVAWLQKHRELSRLKAVLCVFAAFTILIGVFLSFLLPKVINQAGELMSDREKLGQKFQSRIEGLQEHITGALPLVDWLTGYVDPASEKGEVIEKPYPFPVFDKNNKFSGYRKSNGERVSAEKALKKEAAKDSQKEASSNLENDPEPSLANLTEDSPDTENEDLSRQESDLESVTEGEPQASQSEDSEETVPAKPSDSHLENDPEPSLADLAEDSPDTENEDLSSPESDLESATEGEPQASQSEDSEETVPAKPSDSQIASLPGFTPEQLKAVRDYYKSTRDLNFDDTKLGILLTDNWKGITTTLLTWLQATTKVFGLLGYLLGFLLVPIYLYYFLNESSKIKSTWHQYIPLKASKFKDEVVSTLSEINGYLISFFRGQVLVSLIDGVLVGIALSIFQLPYGFLIGLSLAVLGILPFIGNILCMIPASFIAFIHFGGSDANHQWLGDSPWAYVGAVIGIFLVVQQINSLVTAPKIVGDSVGLHPMTVIFSILFWSLLLGGFLGALMAVPLTAAVKVLFTRYVWQARVSPQLNSPPSSDPSLLTEQES